MKFKAIKSFKITGTSLELFPPIRLDTMDDTAPSIPLAKKEKITSIINSALINMANSLEAKENKTRTTYHATIFKNFPKEKGNPTDMHCLKRSYRKAQSVVLFSVRFL